MSFDVSLTDGAMSDIRGILQWIGSRSRTGAETWYRSWRNVLQAIRDRADQFGVAPESDDHPELIRHALFKTRRGRSYRALFIIRDRNVFVLHIRGPGQDLLRSDEIQNSH